MLREFTKDTGRFAKGENRDYPQTVWDQLEASVGKPLGTFTKALGETPRTHVQMEQARSRREEHVV